MNPIRLLVLCALLLASAVHAFAAPPLVYRRDILTIHPPAPVVVQEETADSSPPAPPRAPVELATELRSEQALRLDWVHSLSRLGERDSMTIIFDPPRYSAIYPLNFYQPLDILSIDPRGRIIQIVPELVLFELGEAIDSGEPIRARLFLPGGTAEALGIRPGDRVQHPLFTPGPRILTP